MQTSILSTLPTIDTTVPETGMAINSNDLNLLEMYILDQLRTTAIDKQTKRSTYFQNPSTMSSMNQSKCIRSFFLVRISFLF